METGSQSSPELGERMTVKTIKTRCVRIMTQRVFLPVAGLEPAWFPA